MSCLILTSLVLCSFCVLFCLLASLKLISTYVTFSSLVLIVIYKGTDRRQGRRRKKLLDDLKDRRGYCELKEEAVDRTVWRNRFARGFGPVV